MGAKGAQQKAHERGELGGLGLGEMTALKQVTYVQFFLGEVVSQPDGSKVVPFIVPNGEVHVFPLSADAAQQLGAQLLAPSVAIPRPGDIPPAPPGPPLPDQRLR